MVQAPILVHLICEYYGRRPQCRQPSVAALTEASPPTVGSITFRTPECSETFVILDYDLRMTHASNPELQEVSTHPIHIPVFPTASSTGRALSVWNYHANDA